MSGSATDGNDIIILGTPGEVNGFKGDDSITGSFGADTIFGGAGNDTLNGGNDFDLIRGGLGDDSLIGGAGGDTLRGAEGDDTLYGGAGEDVIYGGEGADTIIFVNITEGLDFVVGFEAGSDRIAVSAAGFQGGLVAGANVAQNKLFITVNRLGGDVDATTAAGTGQFIYDADVGNLWWDVDGAGGREELLVAQIVNVADFAAAIFTAGDLTVVA